MANLNPRVPYMGSDSTDPGLHLWARQVTIQMNLLPPTSVFSFTTPNSNVSALPGTWGQNVASTGSVVWFKQVGSGNTGWVALA